MDDYAQLLRCIRCESTDELQFYAITALTNATIKYRMLLPSQKVYSYETVEVPVCATCKKDFDNWNLKKKKTRYPLLVSFTYLMVLIIVIGMLFLSRNLITLSFQELLTLILVLIIPEIVITTYTIYIRRKISLLHTNPHKYFKNKGKGRLYVRPQHHKKWIPYEEWIVSSRFERFDGEKN